MHSEAWQPLSKEDILMPKTKFQEVIFTIIMATFMVYGMIFYNIALATKEVTGETFLNAFHELPVMTGIAFVLELFVVGKIARMLVFSVMDQNDRPQFLIYANSICICCLMCPIMSFVAMLLFNGSSPSVGLWIQTWALNFPMAVMYRLFYCGPLVRLIFRSLFERNEEKRQWKLNRVANRGVDD